MVITLLESGVRVFIFVCPTVRVQTINVGQYLRAVFTVNKSEELTKGNDMKLDHISNTDSHLTLVYWAVNTGVI